MKARSCGRLRTPLTSSLKKGKRNSFNSSLTTRYAAGLLFTGAVRLFGVLRAAMVSICVFGIPVTRKLPVTLYHTQVLNNLAIVGPETSGGVDSRLQEC